MLRGRTPRVRALCALALVGLLAACSSAADEPTVTPSDDSEPSASVTSEPEPEPVDRFAVPTLPDGDLEVQAVVKGRITPAMEGSSTRGQVVVTEDLLLLMPSDQRIHALDRETGEEVWTAKTWVDKDGYGPCRQPTPPDGATAVVVFSGIRCGLRESFSLEDGSRLGRDRSVDALGSSVTDPTHVAGHVYFADDEGLHQVLPDGSTELVLATAQLGFRDEYRDIDALTAIAGSDVLMARSNGSLLGGRDTLIGFRPSEEDDLEEVWRRDVTAVHGQEAMPDNTFLYPSLDGVLIDTVRRGVVTPRLLTVDPETGRREHTYVLQRDPPGGYPSWIENKFVEETLVDPRGSVFSAAGEGGFSYTPNIARHDLVRNRVAWAWDPEFKPDSGVSGFPLAVSDDGEHVYVLWGEYNDFRLVELDHRTGRQQRVWRVPPGAAETLTHATGVLVGDQLILYNIYGSRYDDGLGLVLRVGGG